MFRFTSAPITSAPIATAPKEPVNRNTVFKRHLLAELKSTCYHYVEIKFSANHFAHDIVFMSASRAELIQLIMELSNDVIKCDYFITTRSIADSSFYYMIWTIVKKYTHKVISA